MARDYGFQACDYILGNDTEVWLAQELFTCQSPTATVHSLAVTGVFAAGVEEIELATPLVRPLKQFEQIHFYAPDGSGHSVVTVTANTPSGSTLIPVEPLAPGLSAVHTAQKIAVEPLFSYDNVGLENSGESIEPRAIGAGDWATKLMTKRTSSVSMSGPELQGDPGRRLIERASLNITQRIWLKIIKPSSDIWSAYCWVESTSNNMQQDEQVSWDYTISVDGEPQLVFAEDLPTSSALVF